MNAQLVVVIAGAILVAAILGSLLFLRGYSSRFTFDTKNGTKPPRGRREGSTPGVAFKGRFTLLTVGIAGDVLGACGKALEHADGEAPTITEDLAQTNQTRTVTTPGAAAAAYSDRNGTPLVTNRASLAVTAYSRPCRRHGARTPSFQRARHALCGGCAATFKTIPRAPQAQHTIATDVRRSTVAYIQEHARGVSRVSPSDERSERQYPYGTLACHVLGYTGTITQEQLDAPKRRRPSSEISVVPVGRYCGPGRRRDQYEQLLAGIRGEQTVTVDAQGNVTGQAGAVPPRAGVRYQAHT